MNEGNGTPLTSPTPLVRYTLGGSTMAAAAGIDPWLSRVGLFLRLKGVTSGPDSEAIEWGKRLEPLVLERMAHDFDIVAYPDDSARVLVNGIRDAARPWLVGHPDAWAIMDGARGIAEAKTTNRWAHRSAGDVPVTWQAQAQTYMHLTDTERAVIGALVDGQRFEVAVVERDDRVMARLLERAEEFYGMLQRDELPPFVGHPDEQDAVRSLYPQAEARTVRASKELRKVVDELRLIREQEGAVARERARLESVIQASMGDAETLIGAHDEQLVTWKNTSTKRIDTKGLRAAHPSLADEFTNETTGRRFVLS